MSQRRIKSKPSRCGVLLIRERPFAVEPNCLKAILKMTDHLHSTALKGIHHVNVLHESWCAMLQGTGECNCNAKVNYLGAEPGTFAEAN